MKKLLVIEDDVNIRTSLVELLEIKDYQVISAKDGEEGLNKAMSDDPDIIICDIMMPKMNGFEVLKELQNHGMEETPFIFLSAMSSKDDINEALDLGATDYLTKPYKAQDLFDLLDGILLLND